MHAVIITGVNDEGITLATLALAVLPTVNNHSLALSHEAVPMELRGFARQYFNHLYVESFSESEKDAHEDANHTTLKITIILCRNVELLCRRFWRNTRDLPELSDS
jgi:hypothetical protein